MKRYPASVFEHESEGVGYVADLIVRAIKKHNEYSLSNEIFEDVQPFVLGLTTGRTPLGLYHELVRRYRDGMVSFPNVAVYSLDEFYPIGADEPQSRNYRIHEEFLNHIDILPENIHIPDGTVPESRISRYCESYDRAINHIDLMIIGVGEQGQLGFNEPGSYEKYAHAAGAAFARLPQDPVVGLLGDRRYAAKWPLRWGSIPSCAPTRSYSWHGARRKPT